MIKYVWVGILLVQFMQSALGQLKLTVIDSITLEPVPFVHVYDEEGRIGFITNQFGQWHLEGTIPDHLLFRHVSYKIKRIQMPNEVMELTVFLSSVLLEPVEVLAKGKEICDVIAIRGFFRSYQIEEGTPKYYMEGFASYYMPTKSHGDKLAKFVVFDHRTFANDDLIAREKNRAFNVSMDNYGPPNLREKPLIRAIQDDFLVEEIGGNGKMIIDKDTTIGWVKHDSIDQSSTVALDLWYKDRMKVRKLLNFESVHERMVLTEVYNGSDNRKELNYENLNQSMQYNKIQFKHKSESEFRSIEWYHEFYVDSSYCLTKKQFSEIHFPDLFKVKFKSNYLDKSLIETRSNELPMLPSVILKAVTTTLIERK